MNTAVCAAAIPPEVECACHPSVYTVTLDLEATCEDNTVEGDGILPDPVCVVDTEADDVVPIVIESIQFGEVKADFEVLEEETLAGDEGFVTGSEVSYTSMLAEADAVEELPTGLALVISGRNAAGEEVVQNLLISYTNDCEVIPDLVGKQIGWAIFVSSAFRVCSE